jgi:hypothetical protein
MGVKRGLFRVMKIITNIDKHSGKKNMWTHEISTKSGIYDLTELERPDL